MTRILGTEGDDILLNGPGSQKLFGGDGNDTLVGGTGTRRLRRHPGSDVLDGGEGNDTADFSAVPFSVIADLAAGTANYFARTKRFLRRSRVVPVRDQLINIENLKGGRRDDRLFGNEQANILEGNDGNDFLDGRNGNDTLDGGDGNDTLIGGKGDDRLLGGAGDDRVVVNDGDGNDTIRGGEGIDVVEVTGAVAAVNEFEVSSTGGKVDFRRLNFDQFQLDIDGVEGLEVKGGDADDSLLIRRDIADVRQITFDGGAGNDVLVFEAPLPIEPGVDVITRRGANVVADGGAGNDILNGSSGRDRLNGGTGDDILAGGSGRDTLVGGLGADSFHLTAFGGFADIQDFNATEGDRIQIKADSLIGRDFAGLGSAEALQAALAFDSDSGLLSLNGVQIARIQNPIGGFDVADVALV